MPLHILHFFSLCLESLWRCSRHRAVTGVDFTPNHLHTEREESFFSFSSQFALKVDKAER